MQSVNVEKIRALCRSNPNIKSITKLEEMLGFGNGYIGKLAKTDKFPPYDRLVKIADALKVSVSELTGEEQKESPASEDAELSELRKKAYALLDNVSEEDLEKYMPALEAIFKR